MIETPEQMRGRIRSLEEAVRTLTRRADDTDTTVTSIDQRVITVTSTPQQAGHANIIPNGEFEYTRNAFFYTTDYVSGGGRVDADVSQEAAWWYAAERDTAIESTGSITAAAVTLTLDTADFIAGDVGEEIVVSGAGTAGADLVTTIAVFTSTTVVDLTAPAVTTVASLRVRWRLQELKQDATDVDYENGEVDPTIP